jgi:hypothetical protein
VERTVARALLLDDRDEPRRLRANRSGATSRSAVRASTPIAKPPFMSAAPLPYIRPSRRDGANGGVAHRSGVSAGTTSMCPFSRSASGPSPGVEPRTW